MKRLFTLSVCLSGLVAGGLPAQAEKKVVTVYNQSSPYFEQSVKKFQTCLKNSNADVSFQAVPLPDDEATAAAILENVSAKNPDLFLTAGTMATRMTRNNAKGAPVVYCMVVDPFSTGIGAGGVSLDLKASDQIDFIRRHFPQFKRIGILYNPQKTRELANDLRAAAQGKVQVVMQEVNNISKLTDALQQVKNNADCLLMLSDPTIYTSLTSSQIILQTIRMNLPLISISAGYVKAGALAGIYADIDDNGCQAADLAADALAGRPLPAGPVHPRKTKIAVNKVVADQLGVNLSDATIQAAEFVIR